MSAADAFLPGETVMAGIRKNLDVYETHRRAVHAQVRWRVPVFLGLLAVATVLLAWALNGSVGSAEPWSSELHLWLYAGGAIAAFFAYGWAMKPATALQHSLRSEVLPVACGFVENLKYRRNTTPDSFARLPRKVVGTFNRQSFDDVITGTYEGFPFELYEAELSHKVGKSTSTVFKGVIIAFGMEASFPGLLVAARRKGRVSRFFEDLFGGSGLVELSSGNAKLDETYRFLASEEGAGRAALDGRLAQALDWLNETWPEAPGLVALSGQNGFLLLPLKKNFFELPRISVPLDYAAHVQPMIADMATLLATTALIRKAGTVERRQATG